eukprot:c18727_g1_i2.p1 GENE.c18727_g1_i2~~c18727_g1_i2.p1  ORF type:complete len:659 (+),score=249.07 c18727_g1_i2:31-2007(+)
MSKTQDKEQLLSWSSPTYGSVEPKPKKRKSILLHVCSFILVTEFCERLSYYGIGGTLTSLLTSKFKISTLQTTQINSLFSSLSYLTPILGAYFADAILGRYKTILLFCFFYVTGLGLCAFSLWPDVQDSLHDVFYIGLLFFVVLGSGGIKPNVVVFGADQFAGQPDATAEQESFFRWFYWAINLGSTFSFVYLANLATNGSGSIQPRYGYFAAFAIIFGAFVIAIVAFVIGSPRYKKLPPSGSLLIKSFRIFYDAGKQSFEGSMIVWNMAILAPAFIAVTVSYFLDEEYQKNISIAGMSVIVAAITFVVIFARKTSWVEVARQSLRGKHDGDEVSEIASVVRLFPYFGFMIMFWAIYSQMSTNFVVQGCQMDIRLGNTGYQLNSASLSAFDAFAILLLIPVFDKILFPLYRRIFGKNPTILQKIGAGFVLAMLSMVLAAYVEIERKNADYIPYSLDTMPSTDQGVSYDGNDAPHCSNCCETNTIGNSRYINCTEDMQDTYECHCVSIEDHSYLTGCTKEPMVDYSIWIQSGQYVLIGIAEILTSTSSYELFYNQAPSKLRSACQALNLLTTCLGTMVTGGLNTIFAFWISDNLNDGKLENMYFLLAGLMLINTFFFVIVSQQFRYFQEDKETDRVPVTLTQPIEEQKSSENDGNTSTQ